MAFAHCLFCSFAESVPDGADGRYACAQQGGGQRGAEGPGRWRSRDVPKADSPSFPSPRPAAEPAQT